MSYYWLYTEKYALGFWSLKIPIPFTSNSNKMRPLEELSTTPPPPPPTGYSLHENKVTDRTPGGLNIMPLDVISMCPKFD